MKQIKARFEISGNKVANYFSVAQADADYKSGDFVMIELLKLGGNY